MAQMRLNQAFNERLTFNERQSKKSRKEKNKLQQHIKQQNLTPSKNTKNRRRHYKEIRQTEAFNT